MSKVFDGRMVAHVWAQGRQDEGRNHNGQFYFEGPALWSYGRHWLVGYRLPDGSALINGDSRSRTTSKHTTYARYAVTGRYHVVPDLTDLYPALRGLEEGRPAVDRKLWSSVLVRHVAKHALTYSEDSALVVLGLVGRARSWPKIRREAERKSAKDEADSKARQIKAALDTARNAVALTDEELRDFISNRLTHPGASFIAREWNKTARLVKAHGTPTLLKKFKARIDQLETVAAEIAARKQAERMERERADREAWLRGEGRYARFSDAHGGAYIRAVGVERDEGGNITGGTLETSHGASVPLVHALKAFRFVKRVRETGQAWHANGHTIRVGHFRVDSIAADGRMRAGCHVIHWPEMVRLAMVLGVADIAATDEALEATRRAA